MCDKYATNQKWAKRHSKTKFTCMYVPLPCSQSHYIEVAQGDIFMEQKMRFGLVLGRLAILKKIGADYEQLLMVFFSCFQGQKNDLKF